ncbi:hypothetical protein [Haloechinothrix salitolerans]|uniref:Homeodomain-like domain-containing protein n=1 Tax=Haloechinothrix salitolerans TaxID=926830 RepID=A0ABW2C2Q4_9PSEU
MAPDLVAAMLDVPIEDVEVDVDFHLPGGLDDEIAAARDATFKAVKAQRLAAEQQRSVVRQLKQVGLKNRDIAAVLKVSNQRVSQLAAKSTARNPANTGKLVTSAAAKGRSVKAKFRTGVKRRG